MKPKSGVATVAEAYRVFDRWCKEYDSDGGLDILEATEKYALWAETNSLEPYLDKGDNNA